MKLTSFVTFNAILFVALGIAFAMYGPVMLSFFGVPQALEVSNSPGTEAIAYWHVAAFARLFGAALFGFGLLLWAMRSLIPLASTETRRSVLMALALSYLLSLFVAVTQQYSIWLGWAGWVVAAICAVFVLGYSLFMIQR